MASRKPPSQRPERKMDDAARAIARTAEEAKAEKSPRGEHAKPALGRLSKSVASRKVVAPPAFPSTKRPKKV